MRTPNCFQGKIPIRSFCTRHPEMEIAFQTFPLYSELDSLLEPESGYPYGVWSDGDVMYVLDRSDEEIYAHWLPQRPAVNTPATGRPSIQGIIQQGKTLTVDTGAVMDANGLERVSYTYQWIRVDGSDADIDGATSATYTPTAEDVGKKLKVRAAFHDDDGFAETRTSSATILVQGTISGCSEGDLNCSGSGPANVRAIPATGFVRVFWDAPPAPNLIGDDARTEVYQYEIHRAVDGGATGLLACVEPDPRRYDDIAVETGKSYRYQVRANYYPSDACARERDIDLGINDNTVYSIWSNGEIMWVAAEWDDDNLLAYDLETGDRRAGDDITLRSGQSGSMTSGLTGHGEYVLKGSDSPLNFSAYLISDGSYDSSKSTDLTGNQRPSTADATDPGDPYYGTAYNGALTGIWRSLAADETTVWATNISRRVFFAYKRSDGTRDPGRDIIIPDGHPTLAQTEGWWLDEAADVMYFMGLTVDDRVFAFDLDKSTVDDTLTVNLNSWQNTNGGVWSDGDIIWVSHNDTTTNRDQLIGYPLLPGRQHTNWAQSAAATAVGEYGELLVKNTAQPVDRLNLSLEYAGHEARPEVQRRQRLPGLPAHRHRRPLPPDRRAEAPETKLTVTINEEDASGNPGSVRCTLTHPAAYLADAVNYYGVPDGCVLLGGESYFVVLERTDATGGTISLHTKDSHQRHRQQGPGQRPRLVLLRRAPLAPAQAPGRSTPSRTRTSWRSGGCPWGSARWSRTPSTASWAFSRA